MVAVLLASICAECDEPVRAKGLCSRHYNAAYYRAHADAMKARSRAWYLDNPEKAAEQRRRRDPEMLRQSTRAYYRAHRLERIAAEANRKARLSGVPGVLTAEAIRARFDYFGGRCWMCGRDANTIDHVKPFAKRGTNWPSNIRPACLSCNTRKQDEWEGSR